LLDSLFGETNADHREQSFTAELKQAAAGVAGHTKI
jgi:hypothetical protein